MKMPIESIATHAVTVDDETTLHYCRVVLRDDEIERIAKAVVQLLKQQMDIKPRQIT